jgi:L-2-hydroxyglutarate oxidase LhgO
VVATDWLEVEACACCSNAPKPTVSADLRFLDAEAMRAHLEPALHCAAAIESAESGIVDVPEYVMALIGEIEQAGGQVACAMRVAAVHCEDGVFVVELAGGDRVCCRRVVNAAGLHATEVARTISGARRATCSEAVLRLRPLLPPARQVAVFSRLIYPMPQAAGLGVHLGMDSAGHVHFGPDVRWIDAPDYQFDNSQLGQFAESIRRWWPALRDDQLVPDFVGVRPKLVGPGAPSGDFVIQDASTHGIANLVNLFGIESPGLTSSLAIGEVVTSL